MIDKRNKLIEKPFSYKITNSDKVIIHRNNKQVMIIKNKEAVKFQLKILNKSGQQIKLVLAKFSGNYKCGNERTKS